MKKINFRYFTPLNEFCDDRNNQNTGGYDGKCNAHKQSNKIIPKPEPCINNDLNQKYFNKTYFHMYRSNKNYVILRLNFVHTYKQIIRN